MKKKLFIGFAFVVMLAIAIPVYLFTRNGKTKEVKRDYVVVRGIGTLWDHEIIVPEGTTIEDAIYILNLRTRQHISHIYTKSGVKKIPARPKDVLAYDTTIQID